MRLEIDGAVVVTRRAVCHYQSDPWPGGHHFRLLIDDRESPPDLPSPEHFAPGTPAAANHLMLVVQQLLDRSSPATSDPIEWFLNRVDQIERVGEQVALTGVASPRVGK